MKIMNKDYIVSQADKFISTLDLVKEKLNTFEQTLIKIDNEISSRICSFSKSCCVSSEVLQKKENLTAVDHALNKVVNDIAVAVEDWQKTFERTSEGREFMKEHQKYLVTMVFGAVKAGKSSLGNFLAGRPWLKTQYDNKYKHIPVTEFSCQEKARSTGGITETDSDGRRWFCEGVVDTTGDIQYFTLSGLRWFDSPGTGSLGTDEDLVKMDELVKKYLQYVDLCIFLVNSSEPGLMEDMKYMKLLNSSNQETLVVITKSDTFTEDCDDEGNLIKVPCPKDVSTRKAQEDYICNALKESYPELDSSKYRAISISTKLAEKSLATADSAMFNDSGLALLMDKIIEKSSKNVIALKMKRPREAFIKFINDIIEGNDDFGGLASVKAGIRRVKENIKSFRVQIDAKIDLLTKNIVSVVRSKIEDKLLELNAKVSRRNSISGQQISQILIELTSSEMKKIIGGYLEEIIGQNLEEMEQISFNTAVADIRTEGIKQRYTKVEHSYVEAVVEEREPEGLKECFMSFVFGTEYSDIEYRERTKVVNIANGTNIEAVFEDIMPQVIEYVNSTVRDNLNNIAENFYNPQEKFINSIEKSLLALSEFLEKQKKNINSEQ
jgi:tRNA U34 5-carboxymethylaminomethyl modifying GTPase MnmE/TrmE